MKLSERMYKHGDTEDFTSIKAVYKWATEVAQLEAENAKLKRENGDLRQELRYWLSLACRQYREMPHNEPLCPMRKGIEATAKLLNANVDRLLTEQEQADG